MADSDSNDLFEEEGQHVEVEPQDENIKEELSSSSNSTTSNPILLDEAKITVSDPEKKTKVSGLKLQETYVSYLIEVAPKTSSSSVELASAWRRYSEFEVLRNYLMAEYPAVVVPPLPEKRANYIWRKLASVEAIDLDFLERRRAALESFVHRVAGHPKMGRDKILLSFVTKEESWKEEVQATGYQAKTTSWLKNTNASLRVKSSDIRLDQLKHYAVNMQAATSNLLKARAKVAERLYGIYKIHGNYSRLLKEWAPIESEVEMQQALGKCSFVMDSFSNSIDNLIDEEDQLAEQVKEYMYFADSLKSVVQKHQALQYEVEQTQQNLASCLAEQKQLMQGDKPKSFSLSGMKARLLGVDPQVQREGRLEQLEVDVENLQGQLKEREERSASFVQEALEEVELWKKRKVIDLRELLTSYTVLQVKMHREAISMWKQFKRPLQNICDKEEKLEEVETE